MRLPSRFASPRLALCLLVLGAGCSSSSDLTGPSVTPTASLTVDASTATAFVALGTTPRIITGTDTTSATAWDISFNATTAALNTTGGVTAYCLCQHESATDVAIMALTADAESSTFESVVATDIPATTTFTADVFTPHKWYRYNLTGDDHQIWPTFNVYLVQRGSAIYKVQITGYYDLAGAPRHISIRSALLRN